MTISLSFYNLLPFLVLPLLHDGILIELIGLPLLLIPFLLVLLLTFLLLLLFSHILFLLSLLQPHLLFLIRPDPLGLNVSLGGLLNVLVPSVLNVLDGKLTVVFVIHLMPLTISSFINKQLLFSAILLIGLNGPLGSPISHPLMLILLFPLFGLKLGKFLVNLSIL